MLIANRELKKYIVGAVGYKESDGLVPCRFTEAKMEAASGDTDRQLRQLTCSGIKIDFYSDTESIYFTYTAYMEFSSRLYKLYYFDIYADDVLILHQGEKAVTTDRTGKISLKLKEGRKRITVYLPGSCAVKISDFTIDDGAVMEKVQCDKNVYFFGDSITHTGYLAYPSLNYANVISSRLNYNSINLAIGGDIFEKEHLTCLSDFEPDIIYVAYGTNDWRWANEDMVQRVQEYFSTLRFMFANAKVNVILPIWRGDVNDCPELTYSFEDTGNIIRKAAEKYGFNVFDGFNFVPHMEKLFHDKYLHPNEMGFAFYADSLEKCIRK